MKNIKNTFKALCILLLLTGSGLTKDTEIINQAALLRDKNQEQQAFELCLAALEKDPSDEAIYKYALELLPDNNLELSSRLGAITAKGAVTKPENHLYYLGICALQRSAGQLQAALANCKKARLMEPTNWLIYKELGLTYSRLSDSARAADSFRQAVELSSSSYKANFFLAEEYRRVKDRSQALSSYKTALELTKKFPDQDSQLYSRLINKGISEAMTAKQKSTVKTAQPAQAAPDAALKLPVCMQQAQTLLSAGSLEKAADKYADCSRISPDAPGPRLARADILLRTGYYEEAVTEYKKAAGLFPPNTPAAATAHLKLAQAYERLHDTTNAQMEYKKTLEANPGEPLALMNVALSLENRGDARGAAGFYERALKADPANTVAAQKLDELYIATLTDAQLAAELQERGLAQTPGVKPTADELEIFKAIRVAQANGAPEYLREKKVPLNGLLLEKEQSGRIRILLTYNGLNRYKALLQQDAVRFFEKKGIPLSDTFKLRDTSGKFIFYSNGTLTPEGMKAYFAAQSGEKTWLMPYETVPTNPQEIQNNAEIASLLQKNYDEVSEPEYIWLGRATDCPDEVFFGKLGMKRVNIKPGVNRYFICTGMPPFCNSMTLRIYLGKYRNGDSDISKLTKSTSFFGSGGLDKRKMCVDGKLWGNEDTPTP